MLRIYPVALGCLEKIKVVLPLIKRADSDLARQLRRAAHSMCLNTSEGMYSRGRNRQARYHTALGSSRETKACLECALALGYVKFVDDKLMDGLDHVTGTLFKLAVER